MKTFEKILIANRGEIALRVIKAAQQSAIRTVAIYAEDDAESLHVSFADEAFLLPGKTLKETYLNQQKIIQIAHDWGAQAIHPGYGFLAENADFAERVNQAGIIFIGPTAENIRLMGEKNQSLHYVHSLGVPILPSFRGNREELLEHSSEINFPVMVKASNGGGGKGIMICSRVEELASTLKIAERQAISYFGNGELFIEKYLPKARHIEVQLMADHHGNVLHFYERECTVQRHFQKIIEEAPCASIHQSLRTALTSTAVKIARSMNYRNAGTIEFLVDEQQGYYFLEMNTRIQVEHPVTEIVTNTDLVALQLLVAAGSPIPFQQHQIHCSGHAIEVRLCAEDTQRNFLPSAGRLTQWDIPQIADIRLESFVTQGKTISSNYDSLLAKIIVKGKNRAMAIREMQQVLSQSTISGVYTNQLFLLELIKSSVFKKNNMHTRYVEENLEAINISIRKKRERIDKYQLVMAYLIFHFAERETRGTSIWQQIGFWQLAPRIKVTLEGNDYDCWMETNTKTVLFKVNNKKYEVSAWRLSEQSLEITINGKSYFFHCIEDKGHTAISHDGHIFELQSNAILQQAKVKRHDQQELKVFQNLINAELFGKVLKLSVVEGEMVVPQQVLLTLESMKTEIHVLCPVHGRVKKVYVKEGNAVIEGQILLELEAVEEKGEGKMEIFD